MQEILPIASGLVLGGLLSFTRLALPLRVALVLVIAACATVASGEYRLSWVFLLPDVAEVAVSCAAVFFGVRAWRRYAQAKR